MAEGIAFCAVLFFALYGVVCLLRRLVLLVLCPRERLYTFSLAYLRGDTENTEQIIRYFRTKADREDVLLLVDNGVSDQQKEIIGRFCENRQDIRFISDENFVEENCNWGENTI